jgi:hypothetical protein
LGKTFLFPQHATMLFMLIIWGERLFHQPAKWPCFISQLIILEERLFHKPATMLFKSADHFGRAFIPQTTCQHAFKVSWTRVFIPPTKCHHAFQVS